MESRINPSSNDKSSDPEDCSINARLDKLASDIKKLPPDRVDALERLIQKMEKKAVSLREASEILGVSVDTVRRAIKSGRIKAFQINERGNYHISIGEIERFMK